MFKVGDEVKCIHTDRTWFNQPTIGHVYKVIALVSGYSSPVIEIEIPEYPLAMRYFAACFELSKANSEFKSNCGKFARSQYV